MILMSYKFTETFIHFLLIFYIHRGKGNLIALCLSESYNICRKGFHANIIEYIYRVSTTQSWQFIIIIQDISWCIFCLIYPHCFGLISLFQDFAWCLFYEGSKLIWKKFLASQCTMWVLLCLEIQKICLAIILLHKN